MQLTFLVTSPRVAPGLLSWSAWQAIASADQILASDASTPGVRSVTAAGHRVDVLPAPSATDLLAATAAGNVVWLATDAESDQMPRQLAAEIVSAGAGSRDLPEVEVLHGSYDVPGARLLDLVNVMDRLRTECPWDREQTHRSLARYLLEESYETLEAIEGGDPADLCEELGDLLLQVFFHARIASEQASDSAGDPDGDSAGDSDGAFDIDDVAGGIVAKLVHRHPHVFARTADADPVSRSEVEENWDALKASEKGRRSILDGIPLALPALVLADKVVRGAAKAGVDTTPAGDEIGDRLLRLVVDARAGGVDAEQALRDAVRRLAERVRDAESG